MMSAPPPERGGCARSIIRWGVAAIVACVALMVVLLTIGAVGLAFMQAAAP